MARDVELGPRGIGQRGAHFAPVARLVRAQRVEAREHSRAPGGGQRVVVDANEMPKVLMRGRGHPAYPSLARP